MTGGSMNDNISSWLELESDPGLFTLLIDDFGVKGVQVEEIYDLSKTLENSIFGFIFLFKWMERRSKRSKAAALDPNSNYVTDPKIVNKMFFAHQIVPNSCATHALLSILLNCKSRKYFELGELLGKFQRLCEGLSPENKGFAIGNQPKLAQFHNFYAKPENQFNRNNQINDSPYATTSSIPSSSMSSFSTTSCYNSYHATSNHLNSNSAFNTKNPAENSSEIFHFICFVPIEGRLYELDGLKPFPVDHGPLNNDQNTGSYTKSLPNWTNKFKNIIQQRLSSFNNGQQNHEIRFNLMALVPDKMPQLNEQIELMKYNQTIINNLLIDIKNASLNEEDFNINKIKSEFTVKNEPSILNKKENESAEGSYSLTTSNDSKPNTRQLRSSRSATQNLKEPESSTSKLNEQLEINFYGLSGNWNEDNKQTLLELCKLYHIENIKSSSQSRQMKLEFLMQSNDLTSDVKENESMSKIKLHLNSQVNKCKLEDTVLVKKITDLSGLKLIDSKLSTELELDEAKLNEELEKRKKYRTDALRRKHIYDEFIVTYLKILNETGKLAEIVQNNMSNQQNNPSSKRRKK